MKNQEVWKRTGEMEVIIKLKCGLLVCSIRKNGFENLSSRLSNPEELSKATGQKTKYLSGVYAI